MPATNRDARVFSQFLRQKETDRPSVPAIATAAQTIPYSGEFGRARRSAEPMRPSLLLIHDHVDPIDEELDQGRRPCAFPFGVFERLGQVIEPGHRLLRQAFDRPGSGLIAVNLKAQFHDLMLAG